VEDVVVSVVTSVDDAVVLLSCVNDIVVSHVVSVVDVAEESSVVSVVDGVVVSPVTVSVVDEVMASVVVVDGALGRVVVLQSLKSASLSDEFLLISGD
jgi:hypothetical protein